MDDILFAPVLSDPQDLFSATKSIYLWLHRITSSWSKYEFLFFEYLNSMRSFYQSFLLNNNEKNRSLEDHS